MGNVHKKFGEVWLRSFQVTRVDRQTHRQTNRRMKLTKAWLSVACTTLHGDPFGLHLCPRMTNTFRQSSVTSDAVSRDSSISPFASFRVWCLLQFVVEWLEHFISPAIWFTCIRWWHSSSQKDV